VREGARKLGAPYRGTGKPIHVTSHIKTNQKIHKNGPTETTTTTTNTKTIRATGNEYRKYKNGTTKNNTQQENQHNYGDHHITTGNHGGGNTNQRPRTLKYLHPQPSEEHIIPQQENKGAKSPTVTHKVALFLLTNMKPKHAKRRGETTTTWAIAWGACNPECKKPDPQLYFFRPDHPIWKDRKTISGYSALRHGSIALLNNQEQQGKTIPKNTNRRQHNHRATRSLTHNPSAQLHIDRPPNAEGQKAVSGYSVLHHGGKSTTK